ncbi:MAG: TIGR03936 family radical SAM-associated protein [Oscillospiraceae bacterium]|nr:TIGR03936 family radical SAM-associated protein [Oscillospiraceae bacterium]
MRMIVAFEKTPRVRHIGHLDLMRAMQRALRRSGLPIRYSQGFNPHVLLSFASPLPVGVSGAAELMDVPLETPVPEAAFVKALSAALPDSLPLRGVRAVEDRHPKLMAALTSAAYEALCPESECTRAMAEAIPALLSRESIPAIRKTKSGEKPCDIRPMLYALSSELRGDERIFTFQVALTELNTLKPDLLLGTLAEMAGAECPAFLLRRIGLFSETDGRSVLLMEKK